MTFIASHCAMMFLVVFITLVLHDKEMLFAHAEMNCDLLPIDDKNITKISCFDSDGNEHRLKCNESFVCDQKSDPTIKSDICYVKFNGNKICQLNCNGNDPKNCTLMNTEDVPSTAATASTATEIILALTTIPEIICRMAEGEDKVNHIAWRASISCPLGGFFCKNSRICPFNVGEQDTCYDINETGNTCKFNCSGDISECVYEKVVLPPTPLMTTTVTTTTTTEKPTFCKVSTSRNIAVSRAYLSTIRCYGNDGNERDHECEEDLSPFCADNIKLDVCHIRNNSELTCDFNCETDKFVCALNRSQVRITTEPPKPVQVYCYAKVDNNNNETTSENGTQIRCYSAIGEETKIICNDTLHLSESMNPDTTCFDKDNSSISCVFNITETESKDKCILEIGGDAVTVLSPPPTTTPQPDKYCLGTMMMKNDTGTEEIVTTFTCEKDSASFIWNGPCESNEPVTLLDPKNSSIQCHITCVTNAYPNLCRLEILLGPSGTNIGGLDTIWIVLIVLVVLVAIVLVGLLGYRVYKKTNVGYRTGTFNVSYDNGSGTIRTSNTPR